MPWNLKSTYFSLKMIHFLSLNIWYVIYVVFWIKYWNLKLPHHCILFLFTICTVSQLFWNRVCILMSLRSPQRLCFSCGVSACVCSFCLDELMKWWMIRVVGQAATAVSFTMMKIELYHNLTDTHTHRVFRWQMTCQSSPLFSIIQYIITLYIYIYIYTVYIYKLGLSID